MSRPAAGDSVKKLPAAVRVMAPRIASSMAASSSSTLSSRGAAGERVGDAAALLGAHELGEIQRILLGRTDERERFEDPLEIAHAEALFDQAPQDVGELRHADGLRDDLAHRGRRDLLELVEQRLGLTDAQKVDGALAKRREQLARPRIPRPSASGTSGGSSKTRAGSSWSDSTTWRSGSSARTLTRAGGSGTPSSRNTISRSAVAAERSPGRRSSPPR